MRATTNIYIFAGSCCRRLDVGRRRLGIWVSILRLCYERRSVVKEFHHIHRAIHAMHAGERRHTCRVSSLRDRNFPYRRRWGKQVHHQRPARRPHPLASQCPVLTYEQCSAYNFISSSSRLPVTNFWNLASDLTAFDDFRRPCLLVDIVSAQNQRVRCMTHPS